MATGKHKDYRVGPVVGTPTFLSLNCHSGASESVSLSVALALLANVCFVERQRPVAGMTSKRF